MTTAHWDWARLAAAERHLRDGEARLAQLEQVVAELTRQDGAAAGFLAEGALVPLRTAVAEVRERVAGLRAAQATPPLRDGPAPR